MAARPQGATDLPALSRPAEGAGSLAPPDVGLLDATLAFIAGDCGLDRAAARQRLF